MERNAQPEKDGFCSMRDWLSTGVLAVDLSTLSPEPTTPDLPHAALVHSAVLPPELRVSICEQNCVCWPFNRMPVFSAISPL